MGRSIGTPEAVPAGRISDTVSGSIIRATWRSGKLTHALAEDGLSAEYEIRYQIGAGKVGHSYAALVGDTLVESPASYFERFGWDLSPGFAGKEILDFNRVLTDRCLFCHTQGGNEKGELAAIGCERCHGATSEHVMHPSAANVINPSRLGTRARDSICEQCHLEGLARIVNPGRSLSDFRPGMALETTLAIYVARENEGNVTAVSQVEQLALSKCATVSAGRLWCGTCHQPHARVSDRKREIKVICTSCHATLSQGRQHLDAVECVACHMPSRKPSDVAHAALTDHRIRVVESEAAVANAAPHELRAWYEPSADMRQRDLGLADLEAAARAGFQALGEAGADLLESLPEAQRSGDAPVLAALGDVELARGQAGKAALLFRRAAELKPTAGELAMYFGISLKQAGDLEGAVRELGRAVQLNPALEQAALALADVYAKRGQSGEASRVLSDSLKWNRQSILVRLTQGTLTMGKK